MSFQEINVEDLNINIFPALAKDWALVTAGRDKVNTMTIGWGGIGVLWSKNVATIYVRESRYTKEFLDQEDTFTVSFYDGYKKELGVLGRESGRDGDKIKDVNFHVTFLDHAPAFEEAKLIFVCKKIYRDLLDPSLFDESIKNKQYPNGDYHYMYIGEIEKIYVKQ